jgi:nitrate/nitrite transport system substrate-binding protein
MVESLDSGLIDGCCVGEPWNHRALHEGAGQVLLTGYDVWNNATEKVFAVRRDWMDKNRDAYIRLSMALIAAAAWVDAPEHRRRVASILSQPQYLNVPEEIVACSLSGKVPGESPAPARELPDFHVFSRYAANFPWLSHAEWFLIQMIRWGHLPADTDIREAAARVYRPDIFRKAADELGLPAPSADRKTEGSRSRPYVDNDISLGPNRFIDGRTYDPGRPMEYLAALQESDRQAAGPGAPPRIAPNARSW